jgi:hypothetical protein
MPSNSRNNALAVGAQQRIQDLSVAGSTASAGHAVTRGQLFEIVNLAIENQRRAIVVHDWLPAFGTQPDDRQPDMPQYITVVLDNMRIVWTAVFDRY